MTRESKILTASIEVLLELKKELQSDRKRKYVEVEPLNFQVIQKNVPFKLTPHDWEADFFKGLYWKDDEHDLLKLHPWHIMDFENLLKLVSEHAHAVITSPRQLDPRQKLAVTLRYLATGQTYKSLESLTTISKSAISSFIPEMLKTIYDVLKETCLKGATNTAEWQKNASDFEHIWDFPHALGALFGRRMRIKIPSSFQSSLLIYGLIDAHCCFSYIDVGHCTQESDNTVFENGLLCASLKNETLALPEDDELFDGADKVFPYFFLGDETFGLNNNLMRPFENQSELNLHEKVFNVRIEHARKVVNCALSKLIKRFGIFNRQFETSIEKSTGAVRVACALHNYLSIRRHDLDFPLNSIEIETTDTTEAFQLLKSHTDDITNDGSLVRNELARYFIEEGSADFQWE